MKFRLHSLKEDQFIQEITSRLPVAVEYDYTTGPILLQVARPLTPAQTAEYKKALAAIG